MAAGGVGQIAAEVRDITRIERIGESTDPTSSSIYTTCSEGAVLLPLQALTPTSGGWGWMTRWNPDRCPRHARAALCGGGGQIAEGGVSNRRGTIKLSAGYASTWSFVCAWSLTAMPVHLVRCMLRELTVACSSNHTVVSRTNGLMAFVQKL